jgi:hypothetical protein
MSSNNGDLGISQAVSFKRFGSYPTFYISDGEIMIHIFMIDNALCITHDYPLMTNPERLGAANSL